MATGIATEIAPGSTETGDPFCACHDLRVS